jgi:hypothetical protein
MSVNFFLVLFLLHSRLEERIFLLNMLYSIYWIYTLVCANLFPLATIQQRGLADDTIQWLGLVRWWLCQGGLVVVVHAVTTIPHPVSVPCPFYPLSLHFGGQCFTV